MVMIFTLCILGAVEPCAYGKFLHLTDIKLHVPAMWYCRPKSYRYIDRHLHQSLTPVIHVGHSNAHHYQHPK
jgi:hypothetical protein